MAAATIVTQSDVELQARHAELEITNGETWTPNLSKVLYVQLTWIENNTVAGAGTAYCTVSGNTVTFNCVGVTDKDAHVTAWGYL